MEGKYGTKDMSGTYYKKSGLFFFFMPIKVPYQEIHAEARSKGFEILDEAILEKGSPFGNGWIAVKVDAKGKEDPNLMKLEGEYKTYEHVGPYKEIGKAFQQIRKDHPEVKEHVSMYLNSPDEASESELRTLLLFK